MPKNDIDIKVQSLTSCSLTFPGCFALKVRLIVRLMCVFIKVFERIIEGI